MCVWPLAVIVALLTLTACGDGTDTATAEPSSTTETTTPAETTVPPTTVPPTTDRANPPPFIDHVEWVQTAVGPSLQIYPTPSGRRNESTDGAQVAWAEVLALSPDANTPGMRAQFDCHWEFARAVAPNKPSWNIEPQRPVVSEGEMISARCNPGGPEE